MTRTVLCAVIGASMAMAATTAWAEDGQMRVKVSDLNVATTAGAQTALARIRWNAGLFCDAGPGMKSLERRATVDRCVTEMTRKSVTQLNAPLVTALLDHGAADLKPAASVTLAQK
jgi:UrcA family protein